MASFHVETRMRGKAQPDGRPKRQSYLSPVVDQSTRAPQQAEAGTGATSMCLYSQAH